MKSETLIDTSVWIDHLNARSARLQTLVESGRALCHPMVLGEVVCGIVRNREYTVKWLREVKPATVAGHEEVMRMVESLELFGRGLGWIDVHLIASALLSGTHLYTHDKALIAAAAELGILAS